ncbi:MAG: GNAT family N-acetyltransferase [Lachnospiraceae bacterium]
MEVRRLTGEACKNTRNLWEGVFQEDSPEFVDYYYENKAAGNIAYVAGEEPYEAMLFRTPYPVQIQDKLKTISYIVGVATREEYRHKGRMTALLMTAMEEMYRERLPFTFLMPANPAIYEPFDFVYVYERPQWSFWEEEFPLRVLEPIMGTETALLQGEEEVNHLSIEESGSLKAGSRLYSMSGRCTGEEVTCRLCEQLAEFANEQLAKKHKIYVKRNAKYYKRQLKELQAQNGDIFLLEKDGKLQGFFLYAREGKEIALQELLERDDGSFPFIRMKEEKKPIIMARIVHLEEMMKLVRSPENKAVLIDIDDPLLAENEGLYLWELTPYGSRVTRQKESRPAEVRMTVSELTPYLLQGMFINEIV